MKNILLPLLLILAICACSTNLNKAPELLGRWERSFESSDWGAGRTVIEFIDSSNMYMDVQPSKASTPLHCAGTYELRNGKLRYDLSRVGKHEVEVLKLSTSTLVIKYPEEERPQEFKRIK